MFVGEYINEDGELALAYETQKTINKQLELELQDEKAKYKAYEKEYKLEIEKLREDNERQQRLLSANLTTTPQSQSEAFMQHEITRLTNENLELQDKNDALDEQVRKLKKQVKAMAKKLKEAGLDIEEAKSENNKEAKHGRALPSLRKKERDYMGMFSYPAGEENNIMKELVVSKFTEIKMQMHLVQNGFCRFKAKDCSFSIAWIASIYCIHVHQAYRLHQWWGQSSIVTVSVHKYGEKSYSQEKWRLRNNCTMAVKYIKVSITKLFVFLK